MIWQIFFVIALFLGLMLGIPMAIRQNYWRRREHYCPYAKNCSHLLSCKHMPFWVGLYRLFNWRCANPAKKFISIARWARPGRG